MFCFVGSTSSGKSTFANALLGEDCLPTSHNAATRVLCEIKYGMEKRAILHLEKDGKLWKEDVDLTQDEGRRKFEDAISPQERDLTYQSQVSGAITCSRVEVFLPTEFLKVCLIVDDFSTSWVAPCIGCVGDHPGGQSWCDGRR